MRVDVSVCNVMCVCVCEYLCKFCKYVYLYASMCVGMSLNMCVGMSLNMSVCHMSICLYIYLNPNCLHAHL